MRAILGILLILVVGLIAAIALGFVDLNARGGKLPEIHANGGSLPSVDVKTGSIGVGSHNTTVDVPTVETKKTTVRVPTLEVRKADER